MVGMDIGSTRDMLLCVVHDEDERQEIDKGDMHSGDVCRELQGGRIGVRWVGGYGGVRVAHVAGGEKQEGKHRLFGHNVCHPTHKTEHTVSGDSGELWANSLATKHHVMDTW